MTGPNQIISGVQCAWRGTRSSLRLGASSGRWGKKIMLGSAQDCARTATRNSAKSFVMRAFSSSDRTWKPTFGRIHSAKPKASAMPKPLCTRMPSRRLDEVEFCAWIGQALPGDVLEYHRGFLALDVTPIALHHPPKVREELARVAQRAMRACEQGLVHLVQRRNGKDDFSYLAIARPKPAKADASLSALLLAEAA